MDQRQRLDRKANLGGSGEDVDGVKGVVVWKGMEGFTGLRVPDSAGTASGDQLPTAGHSKLENIHSPSYQETASGKGWMRGMWSGGDL